MKKIKLTEEQLTTIIKRIINEDDNYVRDFYISFFSNQVSQDDLTQYELYELFNQIENNLYLDADRKNRLLQIVASKIELPEKEELIPNTDVLIYHKPHYGDTWVDSRSLPTDVVPNKDEYNFITIDKGPTKEIGEFSRIVNDVEKKVGADLGLLYPYNKFRKLRGTGDIIIAYKK